MTPCVFCNVIQGTLPSHKIYETEQVIVFAPLKEDILVRGHLLVVPKQHYADLYEIPPKELHALLDTAQLIARQLQQKYSVAGVNLLHASGKAAQQSVFHFHLHLLPRYVNDGLDTWPKTGYSEQDFSGVYSDLRNLF